MPADGGRHDAILTQFGDAGCNVAALGDKFQSDGGTSWSLGRTLFLGSLRRSSRSPHPPIGGNTDVGHSTS